jgi:hypothetical protein
MENLIKQGLAGFEEALAPRKRANYFALADGGTATVRFLQEVDEASPNYHKEAGLATMALICNPPSADGFKFKYVVPPELMNRVGDWVFKTRLLINVLVDDGKGNEEVQLWDASKAVARQLLEFNNEDGTITDKMFRIKRSGKSTDTTYILMPKQDDGGISLDKWVDDMTQPSDYLTELGLDDITRHTGETDDDGTDTSASSWTSA